VWFINAGSVGKPKDGDPRACYLLLDPSAAAPASFMRVPYDIDAAAAAIRATDLPTEFAEQLYSY
jgi:diadenosine tetraphosphatase ApaH/serine/threonine PP2A family protein phosphatase